MTWAYLIVFSDKLGTRDDVQNFLDSLPEVIYWYSCIPMCVFFTSTLPAQSLAEKVMEQFGSSLGQRFLITEVHHDRQGWLPKQAWHLFQNPGNPR